MSEFISKKRNVDTMHALWKDISDKATSIH